MAKKERISIFDSARAKVSSVSKSSKDDKEVVYIDGLESKLLELEFLKAQVKDLSAQEKAVNNEIKDISREKFVELYQANKENPNTFLIKDGEGCVMVIPTDSYKKIEDKDRANQLIEEYGEDVITIEEKYYFNPKVLERNMAAVEKLIMDAKTISDDDKRNLLLPDITYSITKGYIDKLSQYGSKMQTVIDDIQPTIALKNCGGKMEEGGMMGDDFIGNVYDDEEDGTRAINFMKFVVKNLEVQKELENYLAEISNKYFIDYGEQLEEDGYDLDRLFNVSVFADTSIPEYVTSFTVPIDDDINFDIDNSIEEKFGDSVELVPYYYKRGGKVDGRSTRAKNTWNRGASWTSDRNQFNKSQDWEVPMNKRKYAEGGGVDSIISEIKMKYPSLKVESYNNDADISVRGKLKNSIYKLQEQYGGDVMEDYETDELVLEFSVNSYAKKYRKLNYFDNESLMRGVIKKKSEGGGVEDDGELYYTQDYFEYVDWSGDGNNDGYLYGINLLDDNGDVLDAEWFESDQERRNYVLENNLFEYKFKEEYAEGGGLEKWSYIRTNGEYNLVKGIYPYKKQVRIGYLKNVNHNDVVKLVSELNENSYENFGVAFYLTDLGLSNDKISFDSVFIGYETENDEDNRLNVFGLETPIARYIGGMKKFVKEYHIEKYQDYAKGGVPRNVGRDWIFKSKQKWEQDYDRKREYKEYKKEGWLANWFKDGGSVINSKRERVIDYYLQNEDNESLVDYYGVSEEVVYDYDNMENTKIIIDAIIKYHNLDNEETVIEKFDNLGLEEFAKGGVARNVGRDWLFKSKQDWEQKYDRKREWKEYKKEGWLANWFKDGGEANFDYGSDLTDESMVKNNLVDGEISADTLKQIVGCELSYPYQIVGAIKLQKCFMRPYYKLS